jgi:hypothetical protein
MPDDDALKEVAKALGLKDVLPEAYRDLLSPAAKELGQSLVTVAKMVSIAISPLAATVWGFEKIKDWLNATLTAKLSKKDPAQIQTPPLNIAGPILMNLPFTDEEPDLKEMYANLLATAMDKKHCSLAHPSFVFVLQQITSDEAKLLKYIDKNSKEMVYISQQFSDAKTGNLLSKSEHEQHEELCRAAGVVHTDLARSYVDNLLRLRIFTQELRSEVHQDEYYIDYSLSAPEVEHKYVDVVSMSQYGWNFIEACIEGKP